MSIFGTILSKIFPSHHPAVAQAGSAATSASPPAGATAAPQGTASSGAAATPGASTAASAQSMPPVDVEKVLSDLAQKRPEKLNWRMSIVDLMKLLDLDSSLTARKALATELHYSGDMNDSAAMNMWLQKQVMKKLADNGGRVPEDLKD
jgi:hypothetical protein